MIDIAKQVFVAITMPQVIRKIPQVISYFFPNKPETNIHIYQKKVEQLRKISSLMKFAMSRLEPDEGEDVMMDDLKNNFNLSDGLINGVGKLLNHQNQNIINIAKIIYTMKAIEYALNQIKEKLSICGITNGFERSGQKLDKIKVWLSNNKELLSSNVKMQAERDLAEFLNEIAGDVNTAKAKPK